MYKIQINPVVLKRLQFKLDKMQSLREKKQISQTHYKRREWNLYQKQDDLHYKTANRLTLEYQMILLPHFESKKMAKKGSKNM